jgi:hypothetical protein
MRMPSGIGTKTCAPTSGDKQISVTASKKFNDHGVVIARGSSSVFVAFADAECIFQFMYDHCMTAADTLRHDASNMYDKADELERFMRDRSFKVS